MTKKIYEYLTGRYHPDLVPIANSYSCLGHHKMIIDLDLLTKKLEAEGFDLFILSGYRNHLDQLRIWNEKATGTRPIFNESGAQIDINQLSDKKIVEAICRWSAIPGASRHHWGTDIDVFCKSSLPSEEYSVQLLPEEVANDGMFGKLHMRLDELIKEHDSHGYYRPYENDQGGVAPERWHLSYAPLSKDLLKKYTLEIFKQNIDETNLALKKVILQDLEYFFEKYVLNISPMP